MRKYIKRAVSILFAVLLLASMFPFAVFADPISAVAIANGFAQAITAYGASNGVSIIFDGVNSSNTSQIGENMHDLWKRFRSSQQTADDYETIAQAVFPSLYTKSVNALGTAYVAISIADTYLPDIDDFWNWLLSGPAEMVKVDNYYQWNRDSNNLILIPTVAEKCSLGDIVVSKFPLQTQYRSSGINYLRVIQQDDLLTVFAFATKSGSFYLSEYASSYTSVTYRYSNDSWVEYTRSTSNLSSVLSNTTWHYSSNSGDYFSNNGVLPYNDITSNEAKSYLSGQISGNVLVENDVKIEVSPYVGDAIPQDVYIPDTSDPDYGPLPYFEPLDIPWNDTLFGDGTGVLDGVQSEAVTNVIDNAIVNSDKKTIEIATEQVVNPDRPETDDPVSNDPSDYAVIGLDDVFPFCIPFDIYRFLSALAAEPVAPHFTATLAFPQAVGGSQTIDIDFDNPTFNQLAQLLRLLELLAFIVGLALLTRSMFIRG